MTRSNCRKSTGMCWNLQISRPPGGTRSNGRWKLSSARCGQRIWISRSGWITAPVITWCPAWTIPAITRSITPRPRATRMRGHNGRAAGHWCRAGGLSPGCSGRAAKSTWPCRPTPKSRLSHERTPENIVNMWMTRALGYSLAPAQAQTVVDFITGLPSVSGAGQALDPGINTADTGGSSNYQRIIIGRGRSDPDVPERPASLRRETDEPDQTT